VRTVFNWLAKFSDGGKEALLAKPNSGRPLKLSDEEMRWITQAVRNHTPQQFRFDFGI
jgi:transposase